MSEPRRPSVAKRSPEAPANGHPPQATSASILARASLSQAKCLAHVSRKHATQSVADARVPSPSMAPGALSWFCWPPMKQLTLGRVTCS